MNGEVQDLHQIYKAQKNQTKICKEVRFKKEKLILESNTEEKNITKFFLVNQILLEFHFGDICWD